MMTRTSTVLGGAGLRSRRSKLLDRGFTLTSLSTLVKALFSKGEQGFFYDPNDLTQEKLNWRKNLLTYTQDASNAAWNKLQLTVTTNATAAPDGTLTANKIVESNTTNPHSLMAPYSNPLVGTTYVCSIYAKKGERGLIGLGNTTFADFANRWLGATFDLNTGTVVANIGGLSPTITDVGNGWYRLSILLTPTSISSTGLFRVWLSSGNTGVTPSYQGDGVSGLYIWGAQVEVGTTASTYQAFTDFNTEFMQAFPYHALFQDVAGTIPVVSSQQPVGLILDKSKGLALGSELIPRPLNFSLWSKTAAVTGTVANSFTTNATGGCTLGIFGSSNKNTYLISIKGTSTVAGVIRNGSDVTGQVAFNAGTVNITMTNAIIASSGASIYIQLNGAGTVTVDSFTIKAVSGNHAYQTASGSRPLLKQTPILAVSEYVTNGDFSNGTTGWSAAYQSTLSNVAGKLRVTATGTNPYGTQVLTGLTIGKTYKFNFGPIFKTGSGSWVIYLGNISGLYKTQYGIINNNLSGGSYIFTANTSVLNIQLVGGTGTVVGDYADFSNISVKEVVSYSTNQNYLEFDGVDDFLQTGNIDFTSTDKVSLFAGVRKLSDAGYQTIVELSANVDTLKRAFKLSTEPNGSTYFVSVGTSPSFIGRVDTSPASLTFSAKASFSPSNISLNVNGQTLPSKTTDMGAVTYGSYPLYIGRRGGTTNPFTGNIYGLVGIARAATGSEVVVIEQALARNVGVKL